MAIIMCALFCSFYFAGILQLGLAKQKVDEGALSEDDVFELNASRGEIDRLKSQVEELEKQNLLAEQKLKDAKNSKSSYTWDLMIKEHSAYRHKVETDARVAQREIQRLREELQAFKEENAKLKVENFDLQEKTDFHSGEAYEQHALASSYQAYAANLMVLFEDRRAKLEAAIEEKKFLQARLDELEVQSRQYSALVRHSNALEQQVINLTDALDRLVTESGRMAPPDDNTDPTDPRLFLLQQWHSAEVTLRRELSE